MSTVVLGCGCVISRSMFGERELMHPHFCSDHSGIWSPAKSLNQMHEELMDLVEDG